MPATFRHARDIQRACSECSLAYLCLPFGLDLADVKRLEQLVSVAEPLAAKQVLFRQGEKLEAIYAINSGAMKTTVVDEDGLEQVMGFYFPGDLLGLDALCESKHECTATALENGTVCHIPFPRLEKLADAVPGLRRQMMRLMSRALSKDEQLLLTLGRKSSEGRLAALLLDLSHRRRQRGMSPSPVRLSMKRFDLANYLGMRIETISRIFGRLQDCDIIAVRRSEVDILDMPALESWATRGAWAADR